ncbi:MAG TPA: RNA-directed DNA polymerase [Actinomycetota bacterium]|nr:RNA-directed DNA polymerase [Actinomycetota bacterium]
MLARRVAATASLVPAAKPGGARWLSVLDAATTSAYAAAVARVAPAVEGALGGEVVANRVALAGPGPPFLRLQPWRPARARFLMTARRMSAAAGTLLVADVHRCYPSILPELVGDSLVRLGCEGSDVHDVVAVLEALTLAGVPGLPIGPNPSAVLANAVLAPADHALRAMGVRHLRWVDDFWVFAPDRTAGAAALRQLRASLGDAGLTLAGEKTRLIDRPEDIVAAVAGGRISLTAPRYHRPADAHPLPGVTGAHPVVPAEGGVDPRRRTPRAASGLG